MTLVLPFNEQYNAQFGSLESIYYDISEDNSPSEQVNPHIQPAKLPLYTTSLKETANLIIRLM